MSRILLADDSPHAQRMGEFILREEGFEVVTVTDGVTALVRLPDVDPDLVLADVSLPQRSGYELCEHVKGHPGHRHARVVLMAGAQEPINEDEARRVGADGTLRKPFEASVMIDTARKLIEAALQARKPPAEQQSPQAEPTEMTAPAAAPEQLEAAQAASGTAAEEPPPAPAVAPEAEPASSEGAPEDAAPGSEPGWAGAAGTAAAPEEPAYEVIVSEFTLPPEPPKPAADPHAVRAAVTLALDSALPVLIDEITQRVLVALEQGGPPAGAADTDGV